LKFEIQNSKCGKLTVPILDFGFWILDFGLFFGSEACPLRAEQV
jgi:hypothetical protein